MIKRYSSNAVANIFSGAVAAAYQLGVTAIAVSTWEGADFTAWGLALSVAAMVPVLSANFASVVARRLVETRNSGTGEAEAALVLAAQRISLGIASVSFLILFCVGAWVQWRSAASSAATVQFLFLLASLLATNIWLAIWQVRFGQHFADERNWPPAFTLAMARIGGLLGMLAALALLGRTPLTAACGLLAGTWAALLVALLVLPRPMHAKGADLKPTPEEIRDQFWRNLRMLSGFAVAAATSIVIFFSIPPLIALIAPEKFNSFYIASSFNTLVVGVLNAAMLALLAPLARWHATGTAQRAQRMVLISPAFCAGLALIALCVCWYSIEFILNALTDGAADNGEVHYFLALLGLQTIVRSAPIGFGIYILSAGSARQMSASLIAETVLAFLVAVPLGWLFGEQALLLGLSLAAFVGCQISCKAFSALCMPGQITTRAAFVSLVSAQVVGSTIWLLIVGGSLR